MADETLHHGTVKAVGPDRLTIAIHDELSCDGCAVAAFCGKGNSGEMTISTREASEFSVGDRVEVSATTPSQQAAIVWALALPLAIFLAVVFFSAPAALASVMLYYCILYLFRNRLQNSLHWKIRKINTII